MVLRFRKPKEAPLKPLREYAQKVVDLRRRGLPYPYEVVKLLAPPRRDARPTCPPATSSSTTSTTTGRLVPVDRPYGGNTANVVVGVVRNFTARYPEGMTRVILLGDPSRGLGTLAEPECRRILAALDLAERDGRAARMVRPLGRRPDRHGQRHRGHGLDRPACCAGWSSSRRRAARSTSWWRASTPAPSPTGTPRPRC